MQNPDGTQMVMVEVGSGGGGGGGTTWNAPQGKSAATVVSCTLESDGTVTQTHNLSGLWPTADKVLIEPLAISEKTEGGLIIVDSTKDKEELAQVIGTVIAVGGTCHKRDQNGDPLCPEMDGINVGDLILYARYSGAEFPVNGIRYRMVRSRDVIGKATKLPDSILRGAQSTKEVFGANESAAA